MKFEDLDSKLKEVTSSWNPAKLDYDVREDTLELPDELAERLIRWASLWPSGSGFDDGPLFSISERAENEEGGPFQFSALQNFHVMQSNGFYWGWISFNITFEDDLSDIKKLELNEDSHSQLVEFNEEVERDVRRELTDDFFKDKGFLPGNVDEDDLTPEGKRELEEYLDEKISDTDDFPLVNDDKYHWKDYVGQSLPWKEDVMRKAHQEDLEEADAKYVEAIVKDAEKEERERRSL